MTNALRGGVVGLLLTVALYYKIFRLISLELTNVENKSKANQCGLALMYALIFQSMVFSDFGFSTYYGFVMFSIALLLFKKRNGRLFSGKAQANA